MKRFVASFLSLWCVSIVWAAQPLVGVVLEDGTDRPVPYADIAYRSGKVLGQTDGRGRLEVQVESRNASLVLKKNGYDSLVVELQDYPDLLDVVFVLRPNVRDLGSTTVVGSTVVAWENPRSVTVQRLEDAAGMRFDVAEHLSQLPGMSGQKDFSSEMFYDGSRSEEVAYHLGQLRIPNMRHLDVGFPGNLSVVNPHTLKGVELHDHYGSGPLGQGLATSVQFKPSDGSSDEFALRAALGTTLREFYVAGPSLFWDSFVFSARYLDPSMLQNMGEKFFTEFRKRDASACEDCAVVSSDAFTLEAKDFYLRLAGTDSVSHDQWAFTGLYAEDAYAIRQDTATTLDAANSATIIEGHRLYELLGLEYNAASGLSWHAGMVRTEVSDTLRDTVGFRTLGEQDDQAFANFIDGYAETRTTYSLGADKPWAGTWFGAVPGLAMLYERQSRERSWPDFNRTNNADMGDNVLQANARLEWKRDLTRTTLGVGAVAASEAGQALPTFSLDREQRLRTGKDGWRLFGNTAWRADWDAPMENGSFAPILRGGASLKAGAGYTQGRWSASAHGFGRYYPDPALPTPQAFAHYTELVDPDYAWVSGMSATGEWRTLHHMALGMNLSSVYGEYETPAGSLPWTANARLDMVSHLRVYPRSDSLLSLIVTHHAAWHRPLYAWSVNASRKLSDGSEQIGSRSVYAADETTDLFRTDVRMNLDLKSKTKILLLDNVRFYVEADNIFSSLDVSALRFLGADNARQRSLVVADADGDDRNGFLLEPFMAKGMGLYLQFGVEGNFGF